MSAAVVEPVDLPVVFGVSEYRLDRRLPFSVELFAEFGGEHSSHEGEPASGPAGSFAVAFAAVGRDQNREPVASGEVVHVLLVPVLSVGDDDRRLVGHAGLLELAEGGLDPRAVSIIGRRCEKSPAAVVISAAIAICCSFTTASAL